MDKQSIYMTFSGIATNFTSLRVNISWFYSEQKDKFTMQTVLIYMCIFFSGNHILLAIELTSSSAYFEGLCK